MPTPSAVDALPWPKALRPMMGSAGPAPGIYIAAGLRCLPSWFLSALCPALVAGTRLFWIDAGNQFDAYGASYTVRTLGGDSRTALRRIQLARPFNLFQLETMVCHKLPSLWRGEPVVVSDPFPMLYDEDVHLRDARRVLSNVIDGMKNLPAVWMVLSVDRPAPRGRETWARELFSHAKYTANLESIGERLRLQRTRPHG